MPKAWLGELGAKLPQIALAMLAAKRGGPEASAAFMQGLQQSADQRQQLTRQAQLDEERRGLQAQQMAMQERTLASQEARAAADDTRADDQQAFQRRMAAVNFLTNRGTELAATATDAESGERQFSAEANRLSAISGVAPDLLHSMTPSMGPTISRSKAATIRRAARAKLVEVQKVFGEQATGARFADKELAGLLGADYPDGGLTVQDLLQYGDMQATGPTGQLLELAGPKSDEIFPGTSEHAGRTRILRDEFIANSGIAPNAAERRAIDDQARQDTVAPVDPEIAALRKDILRDQASRAGAGASDQIFVIRNGKVTPIQKGTARPGDEPYDAVAARQSAASEGMGQDSPYLEERRIRNRESVKALMLKSGHMTTGAGSVLSSLPGTSARNFKAELDTLKANISFGELAEMRASSKTGGALGAISVRELELLGATLGALDTGQSPAQFRSQLQKVQDSLDRWERARLAAKSATKIKVAPGAGAAVADPLGIR